MIIRQATLLDLLALAPLALEYSVEADKHDNFPFDLEHSMQNAASTIMREDGCFLVVYDNDEPVGFLWGICCSLPWSHAKLALDCILFVRKQYRKSRAGYMLMCSWEQWSKSQGAVEVQISIASGIHEECTEGFYQRLGYRKAGTQYRKEVNDINT